MAKQKEKYSKKSKGHIVYKTSLGQRVPGSTTITGQLDKPALIHWSWKLGKAGIDYRVHRDELADVGSLAHDMILCDLKNTKCDTSEYSSSVIARAENCYLSFLEWRKGKTLKPKHIEEPFVSDFHLFGGKEDYFGDINKVSTLIDWKTGKDIYPEYWLQLAGYDILLRENGCYAQQFIIINIGRTEDEEFKIQKKYDLQLERLCFLKLAEVYHLKRAIKHGTKNKKK